MNNCQKVRSHLVDEQSRIIYDNRLSFSMTGDKKHIIHMLEQIDGIGNISRLKERLTRDSYKKLVIFGAGINGLFISECLDEYNWTAFLDNKVKTVSNENIVVPQTSTLESFINKAVNLPIYNPHYYIDNYGTENTLFVIAVPGFSSQRSITSQLMSLGVREADIFAFTPTNVLIPQYFEVFTPKKFETFVDCGVLDGCSSFDFARWCCGNYRKIFAFEPDISNYNICRKNLSKLSDVVLYNLGVWDSEQTLCFENSSTGFSCVIQEENTSIEKGSIIEIKTCALDDILKDEEITFIKMDIEGAELKALQGASSVVSKQKSKLAVCIYHKPEDIWDIPNLLLELNPEYRFRLRHYGQSACETVLYAE